MPKTTYLMFFFVLKATYLMFLTTNICVCGFLFVSLQYIKKQEDMKNVASKLKEIERRSLELNKQINEEGRVYAAELRDRQAKGLTGDAAILHYNEWMQRNDMEHLMLK